MEQAQGELQAVYYLLRERLQRIGSKQYALRSSIRFRLTMWYVLILGLVLLVFGSIVYASQAQGMSAQLYENLRTDAAQLSNMYDFSFGQLVLPGLVKQAEERKKLPIGADDIVITLDAEGKIGQQMGPIDGRELPKLLTAILAKQKLGIGSNGEAILTAEQLYKLKAAKKAGEDMSTVEKSLGIGPPVARPEDVFFQYTIADGPTLTSVGNQDYLFYSTPIVMKNEVLGTLILGRLREDKAQLQRLLMTLLLAGPATLLIAAIGGYWLATRAMRPVRAITRAAREIGETELNRRLNLETRDELGELASTFDGMLDRLEAAFKRQRQFTADASHELRTPLTIVGLEVSHALARGEECGVWGEKGMKTYPTPHIPHPSLQEYRRALAVIQVENDYMSRLVNNLLVLARADAGQVVIGCEELDLSDLVLEVIERLDSLAQRNGVALQTGALPELKIAGDRLYLSQMLTNLIENAIKYSSGCIDVSPVPGPESQVVHQGIGPGTWNPGLAGKWVRVETGSVRVRNEIRAWVRVEDNGPGIHSKHQPYLFDRFYRVDEARSQNGDAPGGSGLGLSIVQWVAQVHGGAVRVESEIGRGSVFEVWLPVLG